MDLTRTLVISLAITAYGCTEKVSETNGFVSPNEFSATIGWAYPLPADAQDVRARLESKGTQRNFLYLRFRMDLRKLPALLEQWSKDSRFAARGNKVGLQLDIAKADYEGITNKLDWWQPRKIVHGYYATIPEAGGPGIRVWVDSDASLVYVLDVA
jgi:hypothetical protein